MTQTPDNDKRKAWPLWAKIALAELFVFSALWALAPWFKSSMGLEPQKESERTVEIKARLQAKQEKDSQRLQKQVIAKGDLDQLRKDREHQTEIKLRKMVKKLVEQHQEMQKERIKREEVLKTRKREDVLERKSQDIKRDLDRLKHQAGVLQRDAKEHQKQDDIAQKVDELIQLNQQVGSGNILALDELKKSTDELAQQLAELRQQQEMVKDQAESVKTVGAPGHTAWLQELTKGFQEALAPLTAMTNDSLNDTSSLNPLEQYPTSDLDKMDLQNLFNEASKIEESMTKDYQAATSMELATREGTAVKEAQHKVPLPMPQRPQQDFKAMAQGLQTASDVNQFGQKLNAAAAQVNAMSATAGTMLQQMQGQGGSDLAQALQKANSQSQLQTAVRQGPQGKGNSLNLSSMMRQAAGAQGSKGQGSSKGDGLGTASTQKDSTSLSMGGGKGGMGKGQGGGEGSGGEGRHKGEGGASMLSKSRAEIDQVKVDTKKVEAQALPGRKFGKKSSRAGWLYLDTWYVIGPWENKGKIDYTVTHPPEFEIDLGKIYRDGKNDKAGHARELKWLFTQSSSIKIVPPEEESNSTYYAWTEVYFEEGQDMRLAIASDDAAKVWINDLLVWEDQGQSAWNLDEGFRQVYFKAGYNKVLVRIENGPVLCTFSVVVCPLEMK